MIRNSDSHSNLDETQSETFRILLVKSSIMTLHCCFFCLFLSKALQYNHYELLSIWHLLTKYRDLDSLLKIINVTILYKQYFISSMPLPFMYTIVQLAATFVCKQYALSKIQQMALNGPLELYQRVKTNVYLTSIVFDCCKLNCLLVLKLASITLYCRSLGSVC